MVFAIRLKASSTFVASLADVSMKGIDRLSANSCHNERALRKVLLEGVEEKLTFAAEYSTTFLSTRSDLLPMMSFFTSSEAYRSISCSQPLTFENVSERLRRQISGG